MKRWIEAPQSVSGLVAQGDPVLFDRDTVVAVVETGSGASVFLSGVAQPITVFAPIRDVLVARLCLTCMRERLREEFVDHRCARCHQAHLRSRELAGAAPWEQ